MLTQRPLTKSRFKLAVECPAKLNYTGNKAYANTKNEDEFLKSLAEGGYQVGEMAKLLYPGGVEVTSKGFEPQLSDTQSLLAQDDATVFEGAVSFGKLFAPWVKLNSHERTYL
jgi:hypothetical protein